MKKEIDYCLNCKAEECNGDYPYCNGKKKRTYKQTKLRQIGRGNAMKLVALLVKMGYKRAQIAEICFSTHGSIKTLLELAQKNGLLTQEEIDASRAYKKNDLAGLNCSDQRQKGESNVTV